MSIINEVKVKTNPDYEIIQWFWFVNGHWQMTPALTDLFDIEYHDN